MSDQQFTISWASLWKVIAMLALVAILFVAREIVVAVLLAVVISAGLDSVVTWLEKKRIPRILGTLMLYILGIFIIALIIYIIVPIFLVQLNALLSTSGDLIGSVSESFQGAGSEVLETIKDTLNSITAQLLGGQVTFLSIVSQFLGGIMFTTIAFIISFYLTVGHDGVERFLLTILPDVYQPRVLNIFTKVRKKISSWFMGQLVLSAIIGAAVFVGLTLLGVKYSLLLGITAGVFELVPYVGPIFSGSLAVIFAATTSLPLGLYTFILFVLIQQLESHVLIPQVTKYTTDLSPVLVIIALLIGAKVLGLVGVILAVPFAMVFQEILDTWAPPKQQQVINV